MSVRSIAGSDKIKQHSKQEKQTNKLHPTILLMPVAIFTYIKQTGETCQYCCPIFKAIHTFKATSNFSWCSDFPVRTKDIGTLSIFTNRCAN